MVPQITDVTIAEETLFDYMGLPTKTAGLDFNNLHGRAYNLIWNEWFRDENLQDSLVVPKGDGPDTLTDFTIQKRGKRHDYFTSALPWPQKGDAVNLPLGQSAPIAVNSIAGDSKYIDIMNSAGVSVKVGADTSGIYASSTTDSDATMFADLSPIKKISRRRRVKWRSKSV